MPEPSGASKKLQWKWIGISFLMYIVLYLLPMVAVVELFRGTVSNYFVGSWLFGGIIIVGAIAGFLSKGVTIWEPAIAGGAFVFVYAISFFLTRQNGIRSISEIVIPVVLVFLLSLLGAWFGERAQRILKPKTPESN